MRRKGDGAGSEAHNPFIVLQHSISHIFVTALLLRNDVPKKATKPLHLVSKIPR